MCGCEWGRERERDSEIEIHSFLFYSKAPLSGTISGPSSVFFGLWTGTEGSVSEGSWRSSGDHRGACVRGFLLMTRWSRFPASAIRGTAKQQSKSRVRTWFTWDGEAVFRQRSENSTVWRICTVSMDLLKHATEVWLFNTIFFLKNERHSWTSSRPESATITESVFHVHPKFPLLLLESVDHVWFMCMIKKFAAWYVVNAHANEVLQQEKNKKKTHQTKNIFKNLVMHLTQ